MTRLLKQFRKNKRCYYCGAPPPSSREHAPIEAMFEGFSCDSITVPSCDKHNTEKNLDDRAIIEFLIKGSFIGLRYGSLTSNILKAIAITESKLGNANEVTLRSWVNDPQGKVNSLLSYVDNRIDIKAWMRQLTAALVWSATGDFDEAIEWDKATVWSPEFVPSKGDILEIEQAGLELQKLQTTKAEVLKASTWWWRGWSAEPRNYPPDIYRFEISFLPSQYFLQGDNKLEIIFRHWFYSKYSWYVWFAASEKIKKNIMNIAKTVNVA